MRDGNRTGWWIVGILSSILVTGLVSWVSFGGPQVRSNRQAIEYIDDEVEDLDGSVANQESRIRYLETSVTRQEERYERILVELAEIRRRIQ